MNGYFLFFGMGISVCHMEFWCGRLFVLVFEMDRFWLCILFYFQVNYNYIFDLPIDIIYGDIRLTKIIYRCIMKAQFVMLG